MTIYIFAAFLVFFVVWELGWRYAGVGLVFPWNLKKNFSEIKKDTMFIDVRTPAEYNMFHIEGVKHLPEILVCMTGHRSPIAAYKLKKYGFKNVSHLTWGMLGWILSGGPVSKA